MNKVIIGAVIGFCVLVASAYLGINKKAAWEKGLPSEYGNMSSECKAGEMTSCNELAEKYLNGVDMVPKSLDHALTLSQMACNNAKENRSCERVGRINEELGNFGVAKSVYLTACEGGSAISCTSVGMLFSQGKGVEVDDISAAEYYFKGCQMATDLNLSKASQTLCEAKGLHLTTYLLSANDDAKNSLYKRLCEIGDGSACFILGNDKLNAESARLALPYYDSGCELGHIDSCKYSQIIYSNDKHDVPQDRTLEHKYADKACELGDGASCNGIGYDFQYDDTGFEKNLDKAEKYHTKGCNLDYGPSCLHLSRLTDNDSRYKSLLEKSCELDSVGACIALGMRHFDGDRGFSQSLSVSKQYHQKVCDLGTKVGCEWVELHENGLSLP